MYVVSRPGFIQPYFEDTQQINQKSDFKVVDDRKTKLFLD